VPSTRLALVGAATLGALVSLNACSGGGVASDDSTAIPPTATDYVVVDPPTTTVPVTEPPPRTDSAGRIVTTTTIPTEYEVQANDSVYKIAARFGLDPQQLADLNGWSDGVQHTILPGDTIKIAPPPTSVPTSGSVPTSTGDCPTTYTIQAGDTARIAVAERFGITFEQMDAANVNTPGYSSFVVGTPITIPCPST
jgi:LysM repeat protein